MSRSRLCNYVVTEDIEDKNETTGVVMEVTTTVIVSSSKPIAVKDEAEAGIIAVQEAYKIKPAALTKNMEIEIRPF